MQKLRIYHDKTGIPFFETNVIDSTVQTVDNDIESFKILSERNEDSFDVVEIPANEHREDFREAKSYRVNVNTKKLEFTYPDPTEPKEEITPLVPLSDQIATLEARITALEAKLGGTTV